MIAARPSPLALAFFDRYVVRYLQRRFHRFLLWPPGEVAGEGQPRLFALSHASWWDVLVGYVLARRMCVGPSYAPMDEAQLARYRILSRLGVYSVDRASLAGLREFLRYTTERLRANASVWITPQGEITPHWRRPVRFQQGLGHLVARVPGVAVVPVAVAYEFLDEPRPEILVKVGRPRRFEAGRTAARITRVLEQALEEELDALRTAIVGRDFTPFVTVLEGRTSISAVYDRVRALRAWRSGRPDPARHGEVVSDPRRVAR